MLALQPQFKETREVFVNCYPHHSLLLFLWFKDNPISLKQFMRIRITSNSMMSYIPKDKTRGVCLC